MLFEQQKTFWKGRRVLVTGHTGFKGSWLSILLNYLGAKVYGLSLPPCTSPNLYNAAQIGKIVDEEFIDIREYHEVFRFCENVKPEAVFHLAAQPLVRHSYDEPLDTFETNINGTINLLDALRTVDGLKTLICVTTDKVYKNDEKKVFFTEDDKLGGHDPYSASKACAELIINCYRSSFYSKHDLSISSVRAGNVIGGGDWSSDRIFPDIVRALHNNTKFIIRNPNSVRPWQHVIEPLVGYLTIAEKTWGKSPHEGAYNIGPNPKDSIKVMELIELIGSNFKELNFTIKAETDGKTEAQTLYLDVKKAATKIGVKPIFDVKKAIELTMSWYDDFNRGKDPHQLCIDNLKEYYRCFSEK